MVGFITLMALKNNHTENNYVGFYQTTKKSNELEKLNKFKLKILESRNFNEMRNQSDM